ncbi:MAG: DUF434 domain-containing protein, partial [Blastocatellia bacterium]|nr:DUF434 domain-containing protein [Blastocatellia bacterium]
MSADKRRHRGAHPEDEKLFNQSCIKKLCTAVYELSWLLSRGYSQRSALKIVGDRHSLSERQRLAVARASSSEQERELRLTKKVEIEQVSNEIVNIDGFNTIITLEAALGGGILLRCPDSCFRDLSS